MQFNTFFVYVDKNNANYQDLYNYYSTYDCVVNGKRRYSSGLDLVLPSDISIDDLKMSTIIDLEVVVLLKEYGCDTYSGYRIEARSSTNSSTPIRVLSGIIDLDYRGTLKATVDHHGSDALTIKKGERYFQAVAPNMKPYNVVMIDSLPVETDNGRGNAGFGSSNNKLDIDNKPQAPIIQHNTDTQVQVTQPSVKKGSKKTTSKQAQTVAVQDTTNVVTTPVQQVPVQTVQQVPVQAVQQVPVPAIVKKRTPKAKAQTVAVQDTTNVVTTPVQAVQQVPVQAVQQVPVQTVPVKAVPKKRIPKAKAQTVVDNTIPEQQTTVQTTVVTTPKKTTRKAQPPAVTVATTTTPVQEQIVAQARQVVDEEEYEDDEEEYDDDTISG